MAALYPKISFHAPVSPPLAIFKPSSVGNLSLAAIFKPSSVGKVRFSAESDAVGDVGANDVADTIRMLLYQCNRSLSSVLSAVSFLNREMQSLLEAEAEGKIQFSLEIYRGVHLRIMSTTDNVKADILFAEVTMKDILHCLSADESVIGVQTSLCVGDSVDKLESVERRLKELGLNSQLCLACADKQTAQTESHDQLQNMYDAQRLSVIRSIVGDVKGMVELLDGASEVWLRRG